jgi:hypothetical protein
MQLSWPLDPPIPEAGRFLAHSSTNGRAIGLFFLLCKRARSWMILRKDSSSV